MSKEMVKNMIKACIVSRKGGMPLRDINDDYKELVGESIPYATLGYRNLEDFLKSIDFVKITRQFTGDTILKVSDPKVSHIENLVSKQKNPTNRKPKYKGKNKRRRYNTEGRVQPYYGTNNNRNQSDNKANNNNRGQSPENKAYINRTAVNINPLPAPRRHESPPNVLPSRVEKFGGNARAEYAQSKWCPNKPNYRETSKQRRNEHRTMNRFNNFNAGRTDIQNYCNISLKTYYGNSWDYNSHFAYMATKEEYMYYFQSREEMKYAEDTRSWGYQNKVPYNRNAPGWNNGSWNSTCAMEFGRTPGSSFYPQGTVNLY